MKKSLLFLFLLVLGVTQGWAIDYLTLPTSGGTLEAGKIYRVTSTNRTAFPALSVPANSTVTIYIEKGKTLFVRGTNGSATTGATPAISVPSGSTLIITGGGTLRVYGGKAGQRNGTNSRQGGGGAAPAIGGTGGTGGTGTSTNTKAKEGTAMGNVYVRGNVTVRAARGTSYGRRATSSRGADGAVPTYAIGGGGGGGAWYNATDKKNAATGDNGSLYIEKSARVIYLNGRRDTRDRTVSKFTNPTMLKVQYYVDGVEQTRAAQTLREYGTLNVKNDAYSVTTESENVNSDGFTTVTVKKVKHWVDAKGNVYNPKDLVVYNGDDKGENGVNYVTLRLDAVWDENSGVQFNGIHDAYELTQFAKVVNAGKATANGILLADIDMSQSAWDPDNDSRAKDEDGNIIKWDVWSPWVPIGICEVQGPSDTDCDRAFLGVFDGNGYVVSNLTMANPATNRTNATEIWNAAYARAGLIGYARGATIKNVVVKNATLYGKYQIAAVCGRLDQNGSKQGSLTNCGSFGALSLNAVGLMNVTNASDMGGDSRVLAGVVTTDINGDPTYVSSVWSTYSEYNNTKPVTGGSNNWTPKKNYVVATWNNGNDTNGRNKWWSDYTQNSGTSNTTRPKKTWVYVSSANSSWLANGKLCLDLNGNVDGATTWTQTFVNDDDNDPCSYDECPRPTNRGLAVYSGNPNYNRIYTISFESNGGSGCADEYIIRQSDKSMNYPELPTPTRGGNDFLGWFDSNAKNANKVTSTSGISSDITLYAKWEETMTVNANLDPKVEDYYYCTFYYSDQAYEIQTAGALAYKAKRDGENAILKMESVKDGDNVSKIIPAGEAVILRAKTSTITLKAVNSEADIDPDNILYGSDEDVLVEEVSDDIPATNAPNGLEAITNCYVFSGNANDGIGFYRPKAVNSDGKKYLKAHMAFVLLDGEITLSTPDSDPQAKTLSMIFEDDEEQVTGISEHKSESETKKAIFSINGMPLSKLQKGINIVGGKKVFVK